MPLMWPKNDIAQSLFIRTSGNPFGFVLKNANEFDLNYLIFFYFLFSVTHYVQVIRELYFFVGDVRVTVFATVWKNEPRLLTLQWLSLWS